MKQIPVIVVVILGLALGELAHAAPKKQRKQNRVGPYAAINAGMTEYSDDGQNAQAMLDIFTNNNIAYQNPVSQTDKTDISYQLTFGYRFHRFFAAEIALADYGTLTTTTQADLLYPDQANYFATTNKLGFKVAGPQITAIGILPINNSFELYGRFGYLFASTTQDFTSKVEGNTARSGSNHDNANLPVIGIGMSFNLNEVYSIRAEYDRLTDVGKSVELANEDMQVAHLGFLMRF